MTNQPSRIKDRQLETVFMAFVHHLPTEVAKTNFFMAISSVDSEITKLREEVERQRQYLSANPNDWTKEILSLRSALKEAGEALKNAHACMPSLNKYQVACVEELGRVLSNPLIKEVMEGRVEG